MNFTSVKKAVDYLNKECKDETYWAVINAMSVDGMETFSTCGSRLEEKGVVAVFVGQEDGKTEYVERIGRYFQLHTFDAYAVLDSMVEYMEMINRHKKPFTTFGTWLYMKSPKALMDYDVLNFCEREYLKP